MDYETLLRGGAVVAAALLVAGPGVVAYAKTAIGRLRQGAAGWGREDVKDAHTVLEIAKRLRDEGNAKGVSLCQELIDAILNPAGGKK